MIMYMGLLESRALVAGLSGAAFSSLTASSEGRFGPMDYYLMLSPR
jgi:hypothetical protein